jgi:multiple sugar transport system ATP-binding protein
MSDLRITGLHKHYGGVHAVKGIDLEVPSGEFTVLVGPSGCGKSTLLRSIAGLEEVDAGTIEIGNRDVTWERPRDRDIAMVFQSYALYPYMNVFENIAFGLRARKVARADIDKRVRRAAEMLGIGALLHRRPRELSGGQRQRVAIGRAIVRDARLFLFDEPLSNLDAQLRDEMRAEIKRLHQELKRTMIYVTHDQIEAMTLADRIVLLREGEIEQQGSPLELFGQPASRFVAGFLGSPRMNFLDARLERGGAILDGGVVVAMPVAARHAGRSVILGIRPQHIYRASEKVTNGRARVEAVVELVQVTGTRVIVTLALGTASLIADLETTEPLSPRQSVAIEIDMTRVLLFDPQSGRRAHEIAAGEN